MVSFDEIVFYILPLWTTAVEIALMCLFFLTCIINILMPAYLILRMHDKHLLAVHQWADLLMEDPLD